MSESIHGRVIKRIVKDFDSPIIQNDLRGMYVEYMVVELLGTRWKSAGLAWAGWDIQHENGTRIEVKQCAARQIWEPSQKGSSAPRFSIKAAAGHWVDGANWIKSIGRLAHIYIFAWHSSTSENANQCDLNQWDFYALASENLPQDQKSIGLKPLEKLAKPVSAQDLSATVETIRTISGAKEIAA